MPILIEWRDSQSGPIVVCDHCSEQITDAADGNAQWREPIRSEIVGEGRREVLFTHKRCYDQFSRVDNAPSSGNVMWQSQELSVFLWFLTSNSSWDADEGGRLAHSAAGSY